MSFIEVMKPESTFSQIVEHSIIIEHAMGLHGRPSVKLTQLAKQFVSKIYICNGASKKWIDAKSIVKVMNLKVASGDTLEVKAEGVDAQKAVAAIADLFLNKFE